MADPTWEEIEAGGPAPKPSRLESAKERISQVGHVVTAPVRVASNINQRIDKYNTERIQHEITHNTTELERQKLRTAITQQKAAQITSRAAIRAAIPSRQHGLSQNQEVRRQIDLLRVQNKQAEIKLRVDQFKAKHNIASQPQPQQPTRRRFVTNENIFHPNFGGSRANPAIFNPAFGKTHRNAPPATVPLPQTRNIPIRKIPVRPINVKPVAPTTQRGQVSQPRNSGYHVNGDAMALLGMKGRRIGNLR